MQRIAHYVSGGLIVTLPGPDEDHNPETAASLADVLRANPDVPYDKRIEAARFLEDLTASYQGGWYSVISLHGGGSPAAMKQEIWRNYPLGNKVELVERLLESRPAERPERADHRQPPARTLLRHRLHDATAGNDHGRAAGLDPEGVMSGRSARPTPTSTAARSRIATRFWAEQAALIDWQRPFDSVCDASRPPFVRWFAGGTTNLCHNAVDRHLAARAAQPALIHVSTETDSERVYSFAELHAEVQRMAAVLVELGVGAGRPGPDLHADDPRGGVRDARLRAHRRDPFGGVRRLRQRQPGEPDRRRRAEGDRQRRRRQPRRQGDRLQAAARRGDRAGRRTSRRRCCWSIAAWRRCRSSPAATSLYAPLRERHLDTVVPCAWVDVDPSQLHPLHQRHDRPAQGRAARHRRLRGGAGGEHEAHLLRPGRARPTSRPATSAGSSATATSSTAR